jgi:16S rRNA (cytidine1402-2'-O)-methyltransferase
MATGTLFIVATPIGNLEDITARALRVLGEVGLIAAEDTRHSGLLLRHFGIDTPLTSYHEHNESGKAERLVEMLLAGTDIALIADAGTPCISDPGYRVVRAARDAGVPVAAVPGPSALLAALSVSGLPTDRFAFHGFFPRKAGKADELLAQMADWPGTHLFFESPRRLAATLQRLAERLPEAEAAVARELTKRFEEVVSGSPEDVLAAFAENAPRGECVVLVHVRPPDTDAAVLDETRVRALVEQAMARDGLSRRDAVRLIAHQLGAPRREVYAAALKGGESANGGAGDA